MLCKCIHVYIYIYIELYIYIHIRHDILYLIFYHIWYIFGCSSGQRRIGRCQKIDWSFVYFKLVDPRMIGKPACHVRRWGWSVGQSRVYQYSAWITHLDLILVPPLQSGDHSYRQACIPTYLWEKHLMGWVWCRTFSAWMVQAGTEKRNDRNHVKVTYNIHRWMLNTITFCVRREYKDVLD